LYGSQIAERLGRDLAARGLAILSGLARGIDAIEHHGALGASEKKLYELLNVEETRHIDELVENSGLNSSEVLATLFDLEMKRVVRQLPGKQFSKVML
jgi:predicted Rossmann fold nucleotide-binding protein DprA/Smf involved in DNA uptake